MHVINDAPRSLDQSSPRSARLSDAGGRPRNTSPDKVQHISSYPGNISGPHESESLRHPEGHPMGVNPSGPSYHHSLIP